MASVDEEPDQNEPEIREPTDQNNDDLLTLLGSDKGYISNFNRFLQNFADEDEEKDN